MAPSNSHQAEYNRQASGRTLRPRRQASFAMLFGLVALSVHADLNPAVAPGGNIAFDHWSLTIPADANGGNSGPSITIKSSALVGNGGYSSPWFQTQSDGSVEFWTPENGAFMGGSPHPRSELREQVVSGSNSTNWDQHGVSVLDAQLKVLQVPSRDNIAIIGQIHGLSASPLVLLEYVFEPANNSGIIRALVHTGPVQGSPSVRYTLASGVKIGEVFVYQVRLAAGVLTLSYNNAVVVTRTLEPEWGDLTFYFKAGSYLASAGPSATEGARVRFYRIAASHPNEQLGITTVSALPNAAANASYAQQLVAARGAGSYQWSLVSGQPPAGLQLSSSGVVSGAPALSAVSSAPHNFTALVRDAHGNTLAKKFSIFVR